VWGGAGTAIFEAGACTVQADCHRSGLAADLPMGIIRDSHANLTYIWYNAVSITPQLTLNSSQPEWLKQQARIS
jgi:hypothetical protein